MPKHDASSLNCEFFQLGAPYHKKSRNTPNKSRSRKPSSACPHDRYRFAFPAAAHFPSLGLVLLWALSDYKNAEDPMTGNSTHRLLARALALLGLSPSILFMVFSLAHELPHFRDPCYYWGLRLSMGRRAYVSNCSDPCCAN